MRLHASAPVVKFSECGATFCPFRAITGMRFVQAAKAGKKGKKSKKGKRDDSSDSEESSEDEEGTPSKPPAKAPPSKIFATLMVSHEQRPESRILFYAMHPEKWHNQSPHASWPNLDFCVLMGMICLWSQSGAH